MNTDPPSVAVLAARLARAYPSLSAHSAASLAVDLCSIERAQHRHAERCCSGADGGYTKPVELRGEAFRKMLRAPSPEARAMIVEHDPDAEQRAGARIAQQVANWNVRLHDLAHAGRPVPLVVNALPKITLQDDPRGPVLLLQLPGEAEPA